MTSFAIDQNREIVMIKISELWISKCRACGIEVKYKCKQVWHTRKYLLNIIVHNRKHIIYVKRF